MALTSRWEIFNSCLLKYTFDFFSLVMSPLPEEYVRTIAVGLNVTLLLACLTVENAVRAGLVGSIASWLGLDEY